SRNRSSHPTSQRAGRYRLARRSRYPQTDLAPLEIIFREYAGFGFDREGLRGVSSNNPHEFDFTALGNFEHGHNISRSLRMERLKVDVPDIAELLHVRGI